MKVQNKNLWAAEVQALRGAGYQCLSQQAFYDILSSHSAKLPRSFLEALQLCSYAPVVLLSFVPVSSSRL